MSEVRGRKGLKRHDSIYVEVTTASSSPRLANNSQTFKRGDVVHVAEVHDSKSRLLADYSGEESWATGTGTGTGSRSLQLRRRLRQPRKGSETDTLSEVESGDGGSSDHCSDRPPLRQDTVETDRSSHSKTLVVPSVRRAKRASPVDINTSSLDTSSTKDSHEYTLINKHKSRHREPRRGSLTDTLSEATDSESTVAMRPVPPARPSLGSSLADSQQASLHSQESVDMPQPPVRLKKFKRKKRGGLDGRCRETTDGAASDVAASQTNAHGHFKPDNNSSGDDMLVVRVEGCDTLRFLDFCRCPTVRLHIVDPATGLYKRSVSTPDTSLQPLETQPFNMKVHRSVKPTWEEDLIIREPSSLVVSKQSLLLFELFDFVKRNTVAWAFLKLVASNGASNVGRPLRLQMFKPMKNGKQSTTDGPKCYGWWSRGKYCQYKSTLYTSVNCVSSSSRVERPVPAAPTSSPLTDVTAPPAQGEGGGWLDADEEEGEGVEEEVPWTRYPGQSCKLPNTLLAEKECGKDGALCLAFSRNGKLLAVPVNGAILLYTIPSAKLYLTLHKQQGLVYDLAWSEDDAHLLSVSADSTACLWHVKKRTTCPIKVLAHPSYVYCCVWIGADVLATGCSDGVIRAWSLTVRDDTTAHDSTAPTQFLSKHSARVDTLASARRSTGDRILVSADSSGVIIVWRFNSLSRKFEVERELKLKDVRGQAVSRVVVVVTARGAGAGAGETCRLVVQTRDSLVRLVDLDTAATLQVYQGGYMVKSKAGGCAVCGCGRRIWSPSEDGSLVAWDFATGERVASYTVARVSSHARLALALHPLDHILAYTSHSPADYPTLTILRFDRSGDGGSVGQVVVERRCSGGADTTSGRWSSALDTTLYRVPSITLRPPPPTNTTSRLSVESCGRVAAQQIVEPTRAAAAPTPTPHSNIPVRIPANRGDAKRINYNKATSSSKITSNVGVVKSDIKSSDENFTTRDSRLSHIIGKMDLILIQASPKQTASVK